MKLLIVAAMVALAAAEAPLSNYGAPQQNYGAPAAPVQSGGYQSNNGGYQSNSGGYQSNNGGYSSGSSSGGVLTGGRTTNIRAGGAIESERDLQLENEGLLLPSDIVGQDLLDRVVDALSEELAQQERARAATSSAYGVPNSGYGAPSSGYGAPSSGYGVPGRDGGNNGRIQLLIPPDPLKAKLIANYIQRTTGDYVGGQLQDNRQGGYNNGGYN